jgi:hypothetical protein
MAALRAERTGRGGRPAEAPASEHRHRGAELALQLAGQRMGTGCGHVPDLFDRLAAAAHRLGDPLMAIGLDPIGIDVQHQGADFAAGGGGNRHGREGVEQLDHTPTAVGTVEGMHAACHGEGHRPRGQPLTTKQ